MSVRKLLFLVSIVVCAPAGLANAQVADSPHYGWGIHAAAGIAHQLWFDQVPAIKSAQLGLVGPINQKERTGFRVAIGRDSSHGSLSGSPGSAVRRTWVAGDVFLMCARPGRFSCNYRFLGFSLNRLSADGRRLKSERIAGLRGGVGTHILLSPLTRLRLEFLGDVSRAPLGVPGGLQFGVNAGVDVRF